MAKNTTTPTEEQINTETVKVIESGIIESTVPADINKPGAVKKVGTTIIQTF